MAAPELSQPPPEPPELLEVIAGAQTARAIADAALQYVGLGPVESGPEAERLQQQRADEVVALASKNDDVADALYKQAYELRVYAQEGPLPDKDAARQAALDLLRRRGGALVEGVSGVPFDEAEIPVTLTPRPSDHLLEAALGTSGRQADSTRGEHAGARTEPRRSEYDAAAIVDGLVAAVVASARPRGASAAGGGSGASESSGGGADRTDDSGSSGGGHGRTGGEGGDTPPPHGPGGEGEGDPAEPDRRPDDRPEHDGIAPITNESLLYTARSVLGRSGWDRLVTSTFGPNGGTNVLRADKVAPDHLRQVFEQAVSRGLTISLDTLVDAGDLDAGRVFDAHRELAEGLEFAGCRADGSTIYANHNGELLDTGLVELVQSMTDAETWVDYAEGERTFVQHLDNTFIPAQTQRVEVQKNNAQKRKWENSSIQIQGHLDNEPLLLDNLGLTADERRFLDDHNIITTKDWYGSADVLINRLAVNWAINRAGGRAHDHHSKAAAKAANEGQRIVDALRRKIGPGVSAETMRANATQFKDLNIVSRVDRWHSSITNEAFAARVVAPYGRLTNKSTANPAEMLTWARGRADAFRDFGDALDVLIDAENDAALAEGRLSAMQRWDVIDDTRRLHHGEVVTAQREAYNREYDRIQAEVQAIMNEARDRNYLPGTPGFVDAVRRADTLGTDAERGARAFAVARAAERGRALNERARELWKHMTGMYEILGHGPGVARP